jgi:transposase
MLEADVVRQVRWLDSQGWGAKRIARELGVARNTVRRYVRLGPEAEVQQRPGARRLGEQDREAAVQAFDSVAEGNAVVVHRELARGGLQASVRTVQRAVAEHRRTRRAAEIATVRFESAPGHQLQVDFGQKLVPIGGVAVRVYLLVAVLGYSRRIFVKPFLAERTDDWLQGIAEAFQHFGGVTRTVLGDNARALVARRDRETATVVFTPAYLQFCRDWGVEPRACAPYRARTKGKSESAVKYVKRNGLAGRQFTSFSALEDHLRAWMLEADEREHGTTHECPRARFAREERRQLRRLPSRCLPVRERRLKRRVANDALVDVDTVRYSVPHRLVRERVEVSVGTSELLVFFGGTEVARHRRSFEPFDVVRNPAHFAGLWRPADSQSAPLPPSAARGTLEALGRTLGEYAAVVGGAP